MQRRNLAWAALFARLVLGLTFFMAGWWKCFELGPVEHARRFFVAGFAESWIPAWLLWGLGVVVPAAELAGGALVLLGFRLREALVALGFLLALVTYGHLLQEPLFSLSAHIFPRLVLLLVVLVIPREADRFSLDAWSKRVRKTGA
ncbi:MAG: DoxX family membrane protein [Planctomycetota bacterium]